MNNQDEVGMDGVETVRSLANTWVKTTEHLFNSAIEANRATRTAFGLTDGADDCEAAVEPGTDSVAYRRSEWETDVSSQVPGEVRVGDVVTFSRTIEEEDVRGFASASGDTNRLHLDESFAEGSRFGGTIAPGTLVSGLISAALARLPGLTIYLSQEVRFLGPVEPGDELTAVCEVVEDLGDRKFRLTTRVRTPDGETVIDGEAVVLIDDPPESA